MSGGKNVYYRGLMDRVMKIKRQTSPFISRASQSVQLQSKHNLPCQCVAIN